MDDSEFNSKRRVGSVKAAINLYGDRIADSNGPSVKKTHVDFSVKPYSTARELRRARTDIGRYKESRWAAESAKARAESELSNAKKTVKDLSCKIEKSNLKAKTQMNHMERLKKLGKRGEWDLVVKRNEDTDYAQVLRELEYVKQELSKLKLDVASILEQKLRAEKEVKASSSKILSCSRDIEVLRKEIDETNEEQVLVELAEIEALKELEDVEAQREKEAIQFSSKMESTKKKLKEATEEIDKSKELETKLALTMSDIDVLQNELNLVKQLERRVQRNESMKCLEGSSRTEKESGGSPMLLNVTEELEAAKKELASIKEEGFQFMASMDVIRNELKHVTDETVRLKKEEAKVNSKVQNINSKILRAKCKLEAVSSAEEKATSIVTNLSYTLDKLKAEGEDAKKEREYINQEIITIKADIEKTDFEIDTTGEKLQGAMQELEDIKSSEASALEKLKVLAENTMRNRTLEAKHTSTITVSKFEYEYLTNHAAAAKEIADKKVAAAQAWIEALTASEKEILMKTKIAQREMKETRLEEEVEVYTKEKLLSTKVSKEEFENLPRKRERKSSKNLQRAMSRKSLKSIDGLTPAVRAKLQKSASPAVRAKLQKSASPAGRHVSPFSVKRRKNVIPNLAKFFKVKRK